LISVGNGASYPPDVDGALNAVAPLAPEIPTLEISDGEDSPLLRLGPVVAPGAKWMDIEGRVAVRTSHHARGVSIELVGLAEYGLRDGSNVVVAWPATGRPYASIADGFHRSVVPLVLSHQGAQYLHASAVLTATGVVALCGASGTGKSTMAAALERLGYAFWADDAVVFMPGRDSRAPVSIRLRSEFRLHDDGARLAAQLPRGRRIATNPGDRRPLVDVLVLQRAAHDEDRSTPLGAGAAFTALLEHALCFSLHAPAGRSRFVQDYLAVVESVRVRRMVLSSRRDRFPALVREIASGLGPPPGP
jgi:hypothetical protein